MSGQMEAAAGVAGRRAGDVTRGRLEGLLCCPVQCHAQLVRRQVAARRGGGVGLWRSRSEGHWCNRSSSARTALSSNERNQLPAWGTRDVRCNLLQFRARREGVAECRVAGESLRTLKSRG